MTDVKEMLDRPIAVGPEEAMKKMEAMIRAVEHWALRRSHLGTLLTLGSHFRRKIHQASYNYE